MRIRRIPKNFVVCDGMLEQTSFFDVISTLLIVGGITAVIYYGIWRIKRKVKKKNE